jgi:ribonuclease HI
LIFPLDVHDYIGINKKTSNAEQEFNYAVDTNWQGWHQIFCDASKLSPDSCVGVGVLHKQSKIFQQIKLPPESSVFTGECLGILRSVEMVMLLKLKKTVIFTDSKSALLALKRFALRACKYFPLIFDIKNKVYECFVKGYSVAFAWIPGHSGIQGNSKADILAKDAIQCGDLVPYKNYSSDLSAIPSTYIYHAWNELWIDSVRKKGKYYYQIQPNIPKKPWLFKTIFC